MTAAHLTTVADRPWSCHHSPFCEPHSCRRRVLRELDIEYEPKKEWTRQFLRSLQLSWKLAAACTRHRPSEADIARERDSRPHFKMCNVQRNFTGYTQPLDRAYMRAFKNSIHQEVAKHFAEFFLEVESNFELVNLDSSTAVLRQLLLSFVHTAAQNVDSPQHRTAGWRFIDWNEVEQRELLTEAKRLLETGELFPRGTAEEPHAPGAEAEASDSQPEAHVMEPLADDHHSSDGDDAPTGVEESAAPAAPAVAAAPESSHESA